jgi:hypothetical protein
MICQSRARSRLICGHPLPMLPSRAPPADPTSSFRMVRPGPQASAWPHQGITSEGDRSDQSIRSKNPPRPGPSKMPLRTGIRLFAIIGTFPMTVCQKLPAMTYLAQPVIPQVWFRGQNECDLPPSRPLPQQRKSGKGQQSRRQQHKVPRQRFADVHP